MQKTDSFVGAEFPAPNGHVIRVESRLWLSPTRACMYEVSCSKCSKDIELWPAGSMRSTKANLIKGALPCGCAKSRQMTEQQRAILITRKADSLGFGFCGFSEPWKGKDTKLVLLCGIHGVWRTSTMHSFMSHCGCPQCGMQRTFKAVSKTKRILDEEWIQRFFDTGKFHDKISFKRQFNIKRWMVRCEVCADDDFARAGLCNGYFEADQFSLALGSSPCRCSGNVQLTQEQSDFRIKKLASERGIEFVGWEEGLYVNPKSHAVFRCRAHGEFKCRHDSFLYVGSSCPSCSMRGFQPAQRSVLYALISDCGAYIKVGISGKPKDRIRVLRARTPFAFSVQSMRRMIGVAAREIEKSTHYKFDSAGFRGWDGATEWLKYDPAIIEYIQQRA